MSRCLSHRYLPGRTAVDHQARKKKQWCSQRKWPPPTSGRSGPPVRWAISQKPAHAQPIRVYPATSSVHCVIAAFPLASRAPPQVAHHRICAAGAKGRTSGTERRAPSCCHKHFFFLAWPPLLSSFLSPQPKRNFEPLIAFRLACPKKPSSVLFWISFTTFTTFYVSFFPTFTMAGKYPIFSVAYCGCFRS